MEVCLSYIHLTASDIALMLRIAILSFAQFYGRIFLRKMHLATKNDGAMYLI